MNLLFWIFFALLCITILYSYVGHFLKNFWWFLYHDAYFAKVTCMNTHWSVECISDMHWPLLSMTCHTPEHQPHVPPLVRWQWLVWSVGLSGSVLLGGLVGWLLACLLSYFMTPLSCSTTNQITNLPVQVDMIFFCNYRTQYKDLSLFMDIQGALWLLFCCCECWLW